MGRATSFVKQSDANECAEAMKHITAEYDGKGVFYYDIHEAMVQAAGQRNGDLSNIFFGKR
jgi:hypothetical protein